MATGDHYEQFEPGRWRRVDRVGVVDRKRPIFDLQDVTVMLDRIEFVGPVHVTIGKNFFVIGLCSRETLTIGDPDVDEAKRIRSEIIAAMKTQ
jgi:hypothetical protein